MAIDESLLRVQELLEGIEGKLDSMNATPSTAPQAPAAPESQRFLSQADVYDLRKQLMERSTNDLHFMFAKQASKADAGIPLDLWVRNGGQAVISALQTNPDLVKLLDTGGAAPLIRQDLEPILYALFVKLFPAWDRFSKEPANGLVHAYNQITSYGDAQFMTELGTVTDDVSVYARKTTNVSVIATRRGISFKSMYAVQAGGMGYNPEQTELQSALRAIAHKMQKTIFQGQATDSGGTAADELGAYDENGFDGLRSILNTVRVKNVDPTAGTPENMRQAIDRACVEIMDAGGVAPSIVYTRATDKQTFDAQQDANVRYMDTLVNVAPGVVTNAVNTVFGPLPLLGVPGDSIGTYATSNSDGSFNGGETVGDMYILDESTISLPYLGSDSPTVLEIPPGVAGQLTRMFIVFGMWGMAVKAIPFSNKIRIKQAS